MITTIFTKVKVGFLASMMKLGADAAIYEQNKLQDHHQQETNNLRFPMDHF